jgi:hypothetical protein
MDEQQPEIEDYSEYEIDENAVLTDEEVVMVNTSCCQRWAVLSDIIAHPGNYNDIGERKPFKATPIEWGILNPDLFSKVLGKVIKSYTDNGIEINSFFNPDDTVLNSLTIDSIITYLLCYNELLNGAEDFDQIYQAAITSHHLQDESAKTSFIKNYYHNPHKILSWKNFKDSYSGWYPRNWLKKLPGAVSIVNPYLVRIPNDNGGNDENLLDPEGVDILPIRIIGRPPIDPVVVEEEDNKEPDVEEPTMEDHWNESVAAITEVSDELSLGGAKIVKTIIDKVSHPGIYLNSEIPRAVSEAGILNSRSQSTNEKNLRRIFDQIGKSVGGHSPEPIFLARNNKRYLIVVSPRWVKDPTIGEPLHPTTGISVREEVEGEYEFYTIELTAEQQRAVKGVVDKFAQNNPGTNKFFQKRLYEILAESLYYNSTH